MNSIIEKNIFGHCIEVFEYNDHFEICQDGYFDSSCYTMQELIDNLVELIGFLISKELRK